MLKIGLTGNIGSGKTMVSGIFTALGIPVYHADDESKKFLEDPAVKDGIVNLFGAGILTGSGKVDRRALASVVFNDRHALQKLDGMLHPKVMTGFREWAERRQDKPYLMMEAAILFESGYSGDCDYIIHVSCPKEIAIARVVKRDRVDGNSVIRRMQFQLSDEEKMRLADFVIRNDGSGLVIPQVLSIHGQLLQSCTEGNDEIAPGRTDA